MTNTVKMPEYMELYETALQWDYESRHTHEEIANIMQLKYGTPKYHSMVRRANEKLIECGKMIGNVRGEGYIVVKPDNYVEKSLSKFKQGVRRIRKSYKISDYAPIKQMTDKGLSKYRNYNERLGVVRAMTEGAYKEMTVLASGSMQLNK